jgi:hypothetical protein
MMTKKMKERNQEDEILKAFRREHLTGDRGGQMVKDY